MGGGLSGTGNRANGCRVSRSFCATTRRGTWRTNRRLDIICGKELVAVRCAHLAYRPCDFEPNQIGGGHGRQSRGWTRLARHHLDQLHFIPSLLRRALSLEEQPSTGIPGAALGESGPRLSLQRPASDRCRRRQDRAVVKPETNLLYTVKRGLGNPSFYYTLAYCSLRVDLRYSAQSGGGARLM